MNSNNQLNKILDKLKDGEWHCTTELAALFIIDYRRRLIDLKDKGYKFENRRCIKHSHSMKEWRLVGNSAPYQVIPGFAPCCYSSYKFGTHSLDCKVKDIKVKQIIPTLF